MAMNDAPKSYKDALAATTAIAPDGNETLRRVRTRIIRREFPHLDDYLAGLIADAWIREDSGNKNMCLDHKDDEQRQSRSTGDRGQEQEHILERPECCWDFQPAPSLESIRSGQ